MNKKIISSLIIALLLGSPIFSFAQTASLTPDQARIILSTGTDPNTGQTATTAQLEQANQIYYGTYYPTLTSVQTSNTPEDTSNSNNNNLNVCTGDPRLNMTDALRCAEIAQSEGRTRGLNVSCRVNLATYPTIGPETGPGYFYNIPCSVNGDAGHDAVLLAGYNGSALVNPNLNPTWYLFTTNPPLNSGVSTGGVVPRCAIPTGHPDVYYLSNGSTWTRPGAQVHNGSPTGYTAFLYQAFPYLHGGVNPDIIPGLRNALLSSDYITRSYGAHKIWYEWLTGSSAVPADCLGSTGGSGTGSTGTGGTGSTGGSTGSTGPSTITGVVSNHINNARQALSSINSINSSVSLPTFFEVQTPPPATTGTNTTGNTASCGINLDLRIGDNNSSVLLLTTELVKEGLLSAPTSSFDTTVYTAVIAYQEKYASSILSPVGLTRGSGFVGPSTRSFMNSRITCSSSNPGTSTTTGGSSTATGLQNQINDLQRLIDSLLAQLNGTGSTSGTGTTNTNNTVTVPTTFSPSQTINGPVSFRYLKVDTKSRSWVAWREIEVYDPQGNKITPTTGQVSCEWCNNSYGRNNLTGGADKVYDGDISSTWNAGETAPGCSWSTLNQTLSACIAANSSDFNMSRSAWIVLDYGSIRNVSKIRLLTENNPSPARAEHVISVGTSNNPSNQIAAFGGLVPANTWIEVIVSQ